MRTNFVVCIVLSFFYSQVAYSKIYIDYQRYSMNTFWLLIQSLIPDTKYSLDAILFEYTDQQYLDDQDLKFIIVSQKTQLIIVSLFNSLSDNDPDQVPQVFNYQQEKKNQFNKNNQYMIQNKALKTKQGNIFERKVSKNIHSIILGYLTFKDIMRLKSVNQYNYDLVLFQYPQIIQRCQQQLAQLKDIQQALILAENKKHQEFYDTYGEYMDTGGLLHRCQLNRGNLQEFFNLKNPNKLTEDLKIALYQLLNNTVKVDIHYNIWVNQAREQFEHKYYPIVLAKALNLTVKDLKQQVLDQIRSILTKENQEKIQTKSKAASSVFIYIKDIVNFEAEEPQLKIIRDIKQVENNLKVLLKAKK